MVKITREGWDIPLLMQTEQSLRLHGELDTMNRVTSIDITSGTVGASALASSGTTPVARMTFSYRPNSLLEKLSFGKGLSTSYRYNG